MRPLIFVGILFGSSAPALAIDWLTAPSYYTHDPIHAERVAQYSPIGPFYYYQRPDFSRSGYRHYRSSIQAGGSADNLHIVEEWGRPVVPYEAWRYPYRPYGVPYDLWGPPANPYGGFYGPGPWHSGPASVQPPLSIPNAPGPWFDGHWPTYDRHDRSRYFEPY